MAYLRGKKWMCKIPDPRTSGCYLYFPLGEKSEMTKTMAKQLESEKRLEVRREAEEFFDISEYQDMTVADLLDHWLVNHAEIKRSAKTVKNDGYTIKVLNSALGEINIHDLNHRLIESYMSLRRKDFSYRSRKKVGVSETAIHHELRILKHAYRLALDKWEITKNNPFKKVEMPVHDKKRIRFLLDWEEEAISKAADIRLKKDPGFRWFLQIQFMARITGIRLTELCSVEWQHVVEGEDGEIYLRESKNGDPHSVPFGPSGWLVVLEILNQRGELAPTERLFVDGSGRHLTRHRVSQTQLELCREAGVENYRWHDNRHDCGSKMIQNGATLYEVSQVLGHLDLKSTQRYSHLLQEQKLEAVKKNPIRYNRYKSATLRVVGND